MKRNNKYDRKRPSRAGSPGAGSRRHDVMRDGKAAPDPVFSKVMPQVLRSAAVSESEAALQGISRPDTAAGRKKEIRSDRASDRGAAGRLDTAVERKKKTRPNCTSDRGAAGHLDTAVDGRKGIRSDYASERGAAGHPDTGVDRKIEAYPDCANGKRAAGRPYPATNGNREKRPDSEGAGSEEWSESGLIEGRNTVLEAFRSGRTVDKLYVQNDCRDGAILTILREAKKQDTIVSRVPKDRLNRMSETGAHQGVIARTAAFHYASVDEMFENARRKGEDPFLVILDGVEDPRNLGAVIRTADQAGCHGVIIPKHRSAGLTPAAEKASAGAVNYVPVAKAASPAQTIDELKKRGLWIFCADMDGDVMYELDLRGPAAVVLGSEGKGVSRLIKEKCDRRVAIPMKGNVDSLNVSVAFGILAYEIFRQRTHL